MTAVCLMNKPKKSLLDFFLESFKVINSPINKKNGDNYKITDQYITLDQLKTLKDNTEPINSVNKRIFLNDISTYIEKDIELFDKQTSKYILNEINDLYKEQDLINIFDFAGEFKDHIQNKDVYDDYDIHFHGILDTFVQIAIESEIITSFLVFRAINRVLRNELSTVNKNQTNVFKSIPLKLIIHNYLDLISTLKDKVINSAQNLNFIINNLIKNQNGKKIFNRINAFSQ